MVDSTYTMYSVVFGSSIQYVFSLYVIKLIAYTIETSTENNRIIIIPIQLNPSVAARGERERLWTLLDRVVLRHGYRTRGDRVVAWVRGGRFGAGTGRASVRGHGQV